MIKPGAGYPADIETVVWILNEALATEIVCVLRYKRHHANDLRTLLEALGKDER